MAQDFVLLIIGGAAAALAFQAYQVSGPLAGLGVLLTVSWILYHLKTKIEVWEALGTLLNPFHTGVTFLLIGFTYGALQGFGVAGAVFTGLAGAILGFIISIIVYNFWNIGS